MLLTDMHRIGDGLQQMLQCSRDGMMIVAIALGQHGRRILPL